MWRFSWPPLATAQLAHRPVSSEDFFCTGECWRGWRQSHKIRQDHGFGPGRCYPFEVVAHGFLLFKVLQSLVSQSLSHTIPETALRAVEPRITAVWFWLRDVERAHTLPTRCCHCRARLVFWAGDVRGPKTKSFKEIQMFTTRNVTSFHRVVGAARQNISQISKRCLYNAYRPMNPRTSCADDQATSFSSHTMLKTSRTQRVTWFRKQGCAKPVCGTKKYLSLFQIFQAPQSMIELCTPLSQIASLIFVFGAVVIVVLSGNKNMGLHMYCPTMMWGNAKATLHNSSAANEHSTKFSRFWSPFPSKKCRFERLRKSVAFVQNRPLFQKTAPPAPRITSRCNTTLAIWQCPTCLRPKSRIRKKRQHVAACFWRLLDHDLLQKKTPELAPESACWPMCLAFLPSLF